MVVLGTPNPAANSGNAGRYMSMANGLTTLSAPSSEITNKPERFAGTVGTFRGGITGRTVREEPGDSAAG